MNSDTYFPKPSTPDEHRSNCQFQLNNVEGYLLMAAVRGDHDLTAAHIKAECLVEAATALVKSINSQLSTPQPA